MEIPDLAQWPEPAKAGRQTATYQATGTTDMFAGVLVADDEPAICALLKSVLTSSGFQVWTARHGEEAVECYQQHRDEIDVVLLDVFMPLLDGPQTLEALALLDPEVRCCFMSGHSGNYSLQRLRRMGASCFFLKPLDLAKTRDMLRLQASLSASSRRRRAVSHGKTPTPL